ncbi:MAG: alpha-galactosidase [Lachnospiraceae bacterium]|nr:alpha-galactosidase [Lachnospiraceae bacterium]
MKKIAFIGAGSFDFTSAVVKDILSYPAFDDVEIALMDISSDRLAAITKVCEKIVNKRGSAATITATTNRIEALTGADGVIITILAGGVQIWRHDIEIPKKYGVDICVGDTRGPSGIFRAARTIPVLLEICRDIERVAPEAVVLNYTNPMAMLCRAMQSETKLNITGLCHSVQGTAHMLADWIGAKYDEITYTCAGVNHQAHYLDFKWNGKDAYPLIHKAITERKEVYHEEIVRNELYLNFGYYPTESSGHVSEYNPWFRKRQDLIEKYCLPGTGWNPGAYGYILDEYLEKENSWKKEMDDYVAKEDIDISRGDEYAAYIFNAVFGDNEVFEFNGNIRNWGIIDNLPEGCCVEVPVIASKAGLRPLKVGKLPAVLAIMNHSTACCEELAVAGILEGDKQKIFEAIAFDPLTASVLSLEEIKNMVNEMFEKNKEYLPHFNK